MGYPSRIAVIGVGNEFRHDDGVGWAVIGRLEERARQRPYPPGTTLAVCDGDPACLISLWEAAELAVVIDAAHAHPGVPGRLHRLEADSAQLHLPHEANAHGLGEAVELSRALGRLPDRLIVYAVEVADNTMGPGLSAPVAATVPLLAHRVEEEITRHRERAPRQPSPGTDG
ncbi:hydrogenase maturation protease [Streptomyces sp. ODS28]|uniref:hydrogenase maturation protease n=1 Tax=Streptomyces sp. ODS28 TaxID=3136688 RepID=UPI0031EF8C73